VTRSVALALSGGGARGLAHVAIFEALDELGIRPVAIAGSSIGSLFGAAYAAGMPAKDIRRFVLGLTHDRADIFRRLMSTRASTIASLLNAGFGSAALIDAEKFCNEFLPEQVPGQFAELPIPLMVMATDLHRREQVELSQGALRPALAASIALPTLMRPVVIADRVLVDGAASNPLPFDRLLERADVIVAVDLSGEPAPARRDIPSPWECLFTTVLVMGAAITSEKLRQRAPDLVVRPSVGLFRVFDFMQASAIIRAAQPAKAELKEKLTALLES
jgi:NTE family protein